MTTETVMEEKGLDGFKVKEIVDTAKRLYYQVFDCEGGEIKNVNTHLLAETGKEDEAAHEKLYSVFYRVRDALGQEIFESLDSGADTYGITRYQSGFIKGYLLGSLGVRPFDVKAYIDLSAAYKKAVSEKGA